jgi:hypothetical protein
MWTVGGGVLCGSVYGQYLENRTQLSQRKFAQISTTEDSRTRLRQLPLAEALEKKASLL